MMGPKFKLFIKRVQDGREQVLYPLPSPWCHQKGKENNGDPTKCLVWTVSLGGGLPASV